MTPDEHIAKLQRLVVLYREAWLDRAKHVDVGEHLDVLRRALKEDAARQGVDIETVERAEEIDRGYGLGPMVRMGKL